MAGIIEGPFRHIVGIVRPGEGFPEMPLAYYRAGIVYTESRTFEATVRRGPEEVQVLGPYLTRYTTRAETLPGEPGTRRVNIYVLRRTWVDFGILSSDPIEPVECNWTLGLKDPAYSCPPKKLWQYLFTFPEPVPNQTIGMPHFYTTLGERLLSNVVGFVPDGFFDGIRGFVAGTSGETLLILMDGVSRSLSETNSEEYIFSDSGEIIEQTLVSTEPGNSYTIVEQDNFAAMLAAGDASAVSQASTPFPDTVENDVPINGTRSVVGDFGGVVRNKIHIAEYNQLTVNAAFWFTARINGNSSSLGYSLVQLTRVRNYYGLDPRLGSNVASINRSNAMSAAVITPAVTTAATPYTDVVASDVHTLKPGFSLEGMRLDVNSAGQILVKGLFTSEGNPGVWATMWFASPAEFDEELSLPAQNTRGPYGLSPQVFEWDRQPVEGTVAPGSGGSSGFLLHSEPINLRQKD